MLFSELMCFICIHLIDRVALEIGLGLQNNFLRVSVSSNLRLVCHLSDGDEQEEASQQPQHVAAALINTSPKAPAGVEAAGAVQPSRPESFDVTLQRKDNEGFGFVILTSKTKPPPGGVNRTSSCPRRHVSTLVETYMHNNNQYIYTQLTDKEQGGMWT